MHLWGYVAHPSQSRSTAKGQFLFLGGRYVRDRSLSHALNEAYRGLLMVGRMPVAFLHLEIPPEEVDVNVHPTKVEVRFRDSNRVYSHLLSTLRQTFLKSDLHARLQAVRGSRTQSTAEPRGTAGTGRWPRRTAGRARVNERLGADGPAWGRLRPGRRPDDRQTVASWFESEQASGAGAARVPIGQPAPPLGAIVAVALPAGPGDAFDEFSAGREFAGGVPSPQSAPSPVRDRIGRSPTGPPTAIAQAPVAQRSGGVPPPRSPPAATGPSDGRVGRSVPTLGNAAQGDPGP